MLGIEIYKVARLGSLLNQWHEWMDSPYFALPDTGVSFIVGQEITIYGNSLINLPVSNYLNVSYSCDIGTESGNNYTISPVSGDIGSHSITITFKNGIRLITQKTISFEVLAKVPTGTKKIMLVGDSLTNSGNTYYASEINSILDNNTFTFVGTRGTTVKHEGYGGYKWQTFVEGGGIYGDPFFIGGVLDLDAYFTNNTIDTPDIVKINLGVNDVFGSSSISGDGLTTAEITTIINYAKTLIDAFLAYDSGLQIVLGLPTICTTSSAIFEDVYAPETFSQNLYINNIHKYRDAFSAEFENGTYNSRVDCSYESIHLDRNNNYANGVHPNADGYTQLGTGIALSVNKVLTEKILSPSGITSSWVDDYAQIDFTDNTGGVCQHEVWQSKNGEAYTLVTTLSAGTTTYNNYTYQNAEMKFKIRAVSGTWYSGYSEESTLQTPFVIITDQSTLTQVSFGLIVDTGGTVNIDWNDGSNNDYTAGYNTITYDYIGTGTYYIKLSGDTDLITQLVHNNQEKSSGDIGKWILPSTMYYLDILKCRFTGDLSEMVATIPDTMETMNLKNSQDNQFSGDLSNMVLSPVMEQLYTAGGTSSGFKHTGDLSNVVIPDTMIRFYATGNNFTKLPRGAYKSFDSSIGVYISGDCNSAEIDSFLIDVGNYFQSVTPIKNSAFKLNYVGMGIPSSTGLSAKSSIEAAFTAAGFTATILVNS